MSDCYVITRRDKKIQQFFLFFATRPQQIAHFLSPPILEKSPDALTHPEMRPRTHTTKDQRILVHGCMLRLISAGSCIQMAKRHCAPLGHAQQTRIPLPHVRCHCGICSPRPPTHTTAAERRRRQCLQAEALVAQRFAGQAEGLEAVVARLRLRTEELERQGQQYAAENAALRRAVREGSEVAELRLAAETVWAEGETAPPGPHIHAVASPLAHVVVCSFTERPKIGRNHPGFSPGFQIHSHLHDLRWSSCMPTSCQQISAPEGSEMGSGSQRTGSPLPSPSLSNSSSSSVSLAPTPHQRHISGQCVWQVLQLRQCVFAHKEKATNSSVCMNKTPANGRKQVCLIDPGQYSRLSHLSHKMKNTLEKNTKCYTYH